MWKSVSALPHMPVDKGAIMPIKVEPYDHQKKAFEFVLEMFGVRKKEGDANDSNQ